MCTRLLKCAPAIHTSSSAQVWLHLQLWYWRKHIIKFLFYIFSKIRKAFERHILPTYLFDEYTCVSICVLITCLFWYSLLSTFTLFNKLNLCSAAAFTREIMLLIDFIHTSFNKFKSHIIYLLQYQCIWVCVCVSKRVIIIPNIVASFITTDEQLQ